MTTAAQYLVKQCQTALFDLAGVRWPASDLVVYLNDGQRDLVLARPDANAVTASFVPVAGARQQLPAASMSLIDIPRNTSGNKRAIRKIAIEDLDSTNRDWRSMTGATEIVHFAYDPREPNIFDIYPPAAGAGASIEITYGAYPTDVAAPSSDGKAYGTVTGNIAVNDQWATALYNYMMGRAYAKDVEYGGNVQLAATYAGVFTNLIGVQLQSSQTVAPKN
jgi:hypothetical protein